MLIFRSLDEVKNIKDTAIALGNFDGVHKGHQQLIRECVKAAEEKGLVPAVFTFTNHPVNEIAGKTVIKNIMNFEEKASFLESMGVEYLFSITFDEFVRQSSPEIFLEEILVKTLRMKHAVCGFNYHFGYKAAGDGGYLRKRSEELGYGLTIVPEVIIDGNTVSSTLIRGIIDRGAMEEYEKYTGRLYTLDGTVVEGKRLGRRLGFPTVNLSLNPDEALPPNGVYVTRTYVNNTDVDPNSCKKSQFCPENCENSSGCWYNSVTNVGNKPTVGSFEKNAETHIFGFEGDLYGRDVRVVFIKMTRPERKFSSLEELQEQINRDCREAESYFRAADTQAHMKQPE